MAKSPRGAGERQNQDCWQHLTTCEKTLLFLLILTLTALLTILIFTAIYLLNNIKSCDTPTCIKTSAKILENIDPSIHPCDDFKNFVCKPSSSDQKQPPPEIQLRKQELLESEITENDSQTLMNAKIFYQICSNSTLIEEDADRTLLMILREIGGWPLLLGQNWKENDIKWLNFMVNLRDRKVRNDWFLILDSYKDEDGNNYLMISPPDLIVISDEQRLVYWQTMVNIAEKLNSSRELAYKNLRSVVDFEKKLALAVERAKNTSNKDPSRMTVKELNTFFPLYNLVAIFNNMSWGYAVFTEKTTVILEFDNYIRELNNVLMETATTVKINYMVWKVIESYLPYASDDLRKIYEKYSDIGSRDDFCYEETNRRFGDVIDSEYLDKYVNKETTENLKTMANMIKRNTFEGDVEVTILGYQSPYLELGNLVFHWRRNILRMVNEINTYVENQLFSCLNKNVTRWSKKRQQEVVDASQPYFSLDDNTIYLPTHLVQNDWYEASRPNYLNYASLGKVMGDLFIEELRRSNLTDDEKPSTGVDLAYEGYRQWSYENGLEKKLPGLGYSTKELFWISSASRYCNSENYTEIIDEIVQSEQLKQDFSCKQTSNKM